MPYSTRDRVIFGPSGLSLARLARVGNDSDGYTILPTEFDRFVRQIVADLNEVETLRRVARERPGADLIDATARRARLNGRPS